MNPFYTERKVYAYGARVNEVPLARPADGAVEEGLAHITLPTTRKDRRKMFRRLAHCAVPGYAPLCMDSNDPDTVECGFRQRLLRHVPEPKEGMLAKFRDFVRDFLVKNVPVVGEIDFEDWLASTSYNEERKNWLRKVNSDLLGSRPTRRQCQHISSFVKSEFYITWKHCRMINSRSDAFKCWSGPRFKAIENAVYQLPQFIKHTPVPERPAKIAALRASGRRYFQTDFTAYESHFTPELLQVCECELYRHCLANDNEADFLCSVIAGKNKMHTRTGLYAKIKGRRMSGDMCTSLGNGFTNLMLALFVVYLKGGHIDGFVEGDDGLFCSDVEITAQDYEDLGFTIKIEEVEDPCEASFCGMIFSDSGEIIRDPRRFMMGFGWTQSFIGAGPRIMDELLRAKALSTVYETPQCPIVGAIARYALSKTKGAVPRFIDDGYHVPRDVQHIPKYCPSTDTRLLFEREFGISIATQIEAEECASRGDFQRLSALVPPTEEQFDYCSKYVEVA